MKTIALGSDRAAKIMAVRATVARIATIDPSWANANVVARRVETNAPAMPLTDWQLMQGARERAFAAHESLRSRRLEADIYVGLEGGFHTVSIEGEWHTFLRGWAYATNGEQGTFGAAPSISVPPHIVKAVVEGRRELGIVIDDGFLAVVLLDLQAGGQHANDGHQREADDADAQGDFDHRERRRRALGRWA